MHTIKISIKPALGFLAVLSLMVVSCQKKFDPNSYKPAETFGGFSSSNQIESSALVAHFGFESNLEDSVSKTSAANYGTTYGTGIKGQALQIGLNNYAVFTPTTGIRGLQSMTVAFWMNTSENTTGIQELVDFVDSNQFWSNLDMFLDGQTASGCVFKIHSFGSAGAQEAWLTSWNLTSPWGAWTHIALTYDAGTNNFTFYVNGASQGNKIIANFGNLSFANFPAIVLGTTQFETTPSMTSATTSQPWASFVLGLMDELRIYNTALSGTEVKALYQLETIGN
jgi:hypothetical protein